MSLFPIFKVNKMSDKNIIDTIYVFYGSRFSEEIDDPNEMFDEDPGNKVFVDIFNKDELNEIQKNKIDVIFINQAIHIDDSIGVIKLKLFEAISRKASMSELYLYCLKYEKLNPITVYQNLTQNDKLPLTKIRMEQLLLNLYDENGQLMEFGLEDKIQYTFDDILKLDLNEKTYLVGKPLGQKFVFLNEYPIIADPFLVYEYDNLLENSRREVSTLSSNLLLETGPIFRNTIYLCLAKDVFEIADINDISTEYTSKIYYPFLYQDNVSSLDDLEASRSKLIASTSEKLTPDTERSFENIDMFYNVYDRQKPSDKFSENARLTGIKSLKVIIYPDFKIKIPIDVVFKLVHATHDFPLIKYNPETRQENIYRLFAPELTVDGKKIPYLQKTTIFKLMKTIGRSRSVAVYTNIQYKGMNIYMTCEFEDNGNISVYPLADFESPILLGGGENIFQEIDEIVKLSINPLIEQIKPFFEQSGLDIPLFQSIQSVNVEVRDMKFQTIYNITSPIDINKFGGCISSVFVVESANFKKGIQLRYKRVSNFNKRDSQEAFIIEKIDQGLKLDEIVDALLQQFGDLDEEMATDLIIKIRSELEVTRGANKRRALMIKINPGFQTLMNINLITSELTVIVSGINDIYYLNTIPVYINTIIRITQDISSTEIDSSKINTLCSGEEIEDVEFGQITAQSEQILDENQVPIIKNESPIYADERALEQGEYMDELLDILGFEEDDDDNNYEGGEGSSDIESSESVKSEIISKTTTTSSIPSEVVPEKGVVSSQGFQGSPVVLSDLDLSDLGSLEGKSSSESEVVSEKLSESSKPSEKDESVKLKTPSSSESEVVSEKLSESSKPSEKDESVKLKTSSSSESEIISEKLSESSKPSEKEESVNLEEISIKTPSSSESESTKSKTPSVSESKSEILSEKSIEPLEVVEEQEKLDIKLPIASKKSKPVKIINKEKIPVQNKIKETVEKMENTVRDITGMKLKYPNPFSARLEERMPQLFVKTKDEKFDLYTRMCPFSLSDRRQPVILTKEERDKIVSEHPGEINEQADFIEYGTDAKDSSKKFYYTCPRYWCLLTNTVVTEQDILDGKCGPKVNKVEDAIIPKKSEEVPKGKYVYQFYDEKERKYPGFHKQKTPSGMCIPCCYSNWSTTEMKNRRDICQGKFDEKKAEKVSEKEKGIEEQLRKEIVEIEHYVKGPEKYGPQLGEHRWGFLPISVQKFLHEVNDECQISKTNMNLKLHHLCILRHGVEVSSIQSFIACIASAIFYAQKDDKKPLINRYLPNAKHDVPTIKEMKEIIISAINLDNFIKLQNGDLITSFADPNLEVKLDDYRETKLYKKMLSSINKSIKNSIKETEMTNKSSVTTKQFIIKVAQAFENFKNYLRNEKVLIDYTFLWDLVCMPNSKIFDTGINLIILEIPEDDATNNIELVCPTNHYSVHAFDARKRSLILIKREQYFEPVYGYRNDGKSIHITKTFSEYDKKLPKTLRAVFAKIIKPTLGEKCRAFVSRPNEYRFNPSPVLDKLIGELQNKKYSITIQILNFQGKVIGVLAKNRKGLEGFIPCYPSSLTNLKNKKSCGTNIEQCEYDFVYMNDNIWKPYEDTLQFLKEYYDYEEPKDIKTINCFNPKYFCRVVEDELITGFLTNTNQFVPIKDPIPVSTVEDTIKTITSNNMLVADINTLTNQNVDTKRVEFIKRIQLETNFYNVFRNTIRILFNDYSNSEKRKEIKEECNKRYTLYKPQLDSVIEMLHELVKETVVFASELKLPYKYTEVNENELHTCLSKNEDKCSNDSKTKGSICRMTNDKCQLVIPKENLVNGTDNEVYYYGRMADELIRYNRIKSFIFKPQAYLSFGQIKYNLRDDEIIVLQDLLNQEFFENLIPADTNKFAKYNTFDTAEPIITQTYKKEVELDEIINPYHVRDCVKTSPKKIKSENWRNCFPSGYQEIEYKDSNNCSLYLIIDLVEAIKNEKINLEKVKEDLIEEYKKITDDFTNKDNINKIIDILKDEEQFDANQLQDETITFEQMIMQDGFLPINFDLWLLLVRYEIPSIFISSKLIPETRYNSLEFVCYTNKGEDYVFIVTPAMYRRQKNKLPEYKIIVNNKENVKINVSELNEGECLTRIQTAIDNYNTIEDYIDFIFEKDVTTKYKPKQKGMREIEFEENNAPLEIIEEEVTEPKKRIRKLNTKKIKSTIFLEEEEEPKEQVNLEEIFFPGENIDISPVKNKTRKKRKEIIKSNPHGKRGTRKLPENIQIQGELEII